ncbi:dubious [Schizosaccharomyces pombe]|uniref:Uncharacterized protein c1834.13 n=1 Tax=Schizosaccharomyces pombe (strain 972 / ATCC 24843) TaxID=284812 RepID=YFVD_SCHPO|nr:uncharacterized protein SPAC1834.13 [Schizosaccharomyces pombe]G2TRJ7.1 RecName: Full=Uncharacterized protein c1834.13 [Schizosaccharomyces pombe 972h-]CCD31340.1 sequence orphan [Schizosaccharomyces pombe]|eukprot:NP_001343130.1 uncharacterized protein SPAC1834.13 [Schizosaccharomyces pombe]
MIFARRLVLEVTYVSKRASVLNLKSENDHFLSRPRISESLPTSGEVGIAKVPAKLASALPPYSVFAPVSLSFVRMNCG